MDDETRIIRKTASSFAYLFWLSGVRRGDHAPLKADGSTIGRGKDADIMVDDDTVSAEHARIRKEGEEWYAYDLASKNTTTVAGQAAYRRLLADGDRLSIGETQMAFRVLK